MRKLLSYVAAASLTVGGMSLINGCQSDKDKDMNRTTSSSGGYGSDARTSSGGTYDNTRSGSSMNGSGAYGTSGTGGSATGGTGGYGTSGSSSSGSSSGAGSSAGGSAGGR
jgi:hypothetical protein